MRPARLEPPPPARGHAHVRRRAQRIARPRGGPARRGDGDRHAERLRRRHGRGRAAAAAPRRRGEPRAPLPPAALPRGHQARGGVRVRLRPRGRGRKPARGRREALAHPARPRRRGLRLLLVAAHRRRARDVRERRDGLRLVRRGRDDGRHDADVLRVARRGRGQRRRVRAARPLDPRVRRRRQGVGLLGHALEGRRARLRERARARGRRDVSRVPDARVGRGARGRHVPRPHGLDGPDRQALGHAPPRQAAPQLRLRRRRLERPVVPARGRLLRVVRRGPPGQDLGRVQDRRGARARRRRRRRRAGPAGAGLRARRPQGDRLGLFALVHGVLARRLRLRGQRAPGLVGR
mmetsp:Transcript_8142/g.24188  ORF Transcript_8142/g.24188 Transcript_8142/m.24188 type:complete len:350 (-) Transcript_8142:96-1145(-)